ncbi:MAG: hypothetical protein ACI9OJ_000171 [Myxococcota bacterium]
MLNEDGSARTDAEIATDIEAALTTFDAGTEANQGGAQGPDMAPHQAGPNTGASEGDGTVRAWNDPVWWYPSLDTLLRVTISPVAQ